MLSVIALCRYHITNMCPMSSLTTRSKASFIFKFKYFLNKSGNVGCIVYVNTAFSLYVITFKCEYSNLIRGLRLSLIKIQIISKAGNMSHVMTNPTKWVCVQRRLRSAWASAQSDQSLRCALNGKLRTQAFFMRTAKTLTRLGGFLGWSESSLGAQSLSWFCHEAAQIIK